MDYVQVQHAVAAVSAGAWLRQLLLDAREGDPDCVALRIEVKADGTDIEWIDKSGHAIGGGVL
jgi:hypothetical protein